MDGVIVDLVPGWLRHRGFFMPDPWPAGEYYLHKIFDIDPEHVWHGCSDEWWANLPKTPEADAIIEMVERRFEPSEIYIVTLPVTAAGACGKLHWLERHYPRFVRRYLMTPCRELLADNHTVLLDDQLDNVKRFQQSGGRGIVVPRPWNDRHRQANQIVADLETRLSYCLEAYGLGAWELTGKFWA